MVLEENIQEAALGDYKGLQALAKRKTGEEKNVMMRAADMMRKGQIKDLNMFMKAMDQSTHKAMMPYVDKKHYKALHEDLDEAKMNCGCGKNPCETYGNKEINEANPTGLKIYHKDKSGKEGHAIVFTARDAQRRHNEIKKAGHTATHHSLMYGTKEGPRKPIKEDLDLDFLDEKKLTPAELKKREEIAKSIERDNPDMPMDKKMAIATATAKKVAEETEVIIEGGHEDVTSAKNQVKIAMAALQKMNGELDKLGEEDELPTWWTNKVAIAVDKLDGMADYLDTQVEACWDGYKQEGMKKKGDKVVPNCVPEETTEAVGTAAKYADRSGFIGGKFKSHDRAMELPRKKLDKYRDKQRAKKDAAHKAQDSSMAKRGYAQNVVDRDKAQRKAAKKGLGHQSISYQQGNSMRRGKLPEAFGRDALQKKYEKITKDKTGETVQQRQDWYKKNAEAVKKRMQQSEEHSINEVRGGADEPDKHIVMQLRKAQDVDGNHPVTFRGGKQAKVARKHIDKILKAHDHPTTKPVQKRQIRVAISKSPQHLAKFANRLKEQYTIDELFMNEEMDDDGREVIHTRKADFKLTKVRQPDGRMAYRKVKKEVEIEK